MNKKSNLLRGFVLTLFGLAIAVFLLRQIDPRTFLQLIREIKPVWLILAFLMYLFTYYLRAIRWKLMLLSKRVHLGSLFYITSAHTMLMHLMPVRSGELSYIYFLKKHLAINSKESFATLFLARILDLACLGGFFVMSLFMLWHQIHAPVLRMMMITVIFLPLLITALFSASSRTGIAKIKSVLEKWGLLRFHIVLRIIEWLTEFGHTFDMLKKSGRLIYYVCLSILIWGIKFLSFFYILRSFGFPDGISLWATVFGTTFTEVTAILPIHGLAGLGTIEGGWTVGFLLLGLPKDFVIASGFSFHLILLLFASVLGCIGLFQLWKTGSSLPS
ncbi:MAG: lysylphosphatidylglycerol synthase transmembrane domain-containing protein [Chlamydiota bacterium]|nr:lysylphosphatidylglycerol synthase transmembrane domain-containing protein [Chlamydiota bacterium]